MPDYKNIFKNRYPELTGKDWINRVSEEDRKAFVHIGFTASDFGRKGGQARAKTAKRDSKGKFVKS